MSNTTIRKATHINVPPLIDIHCDTLVLGSMLSPKSAQAEFYYAHPQNRFWRVLSAVFDTDFPKNTADRRRLALDNGIALWDVISECNIIGAADSTITDVIYNDINGLLKDYTTIKRIFTTGKKAYELLMRYNAAINNAVISATVNLPSTSPQNRTLSTNDIIAIYSKHLLQK